MTEETEAPDRCPRGAIDESLDYDRIAVVDVVVDIVDIVFDIVASVVVVVVFRPFA